MVRMRPPSVPVDPPEVLREGDRVVVVEQDALLQLYQPTRSCRTSSGGVSGGSAGSRPAALGDGDEANRPNQANSRTAEQVALNGSASPSESSPGSRGSVLPLGSDGSVSSGNGLGFLGFRCQLGASVNGAPPVSWPA